MKGNNISRSTGFIAAGVFSAILVAMAWPGLSYAQQSHTILLAGYKAVPRAATPASGEATITLKADTLTVKGSFSDLSSRYFGAGIFYGKKEENGNQIISLKPSLNDEYTGGRFKPSENTFVLTEGQLEALKNGLLYLAIYTYDYQRGELRAQLPAFK